MSALLTNEQIDAIAYGAEYPGQHQASLLSHARAANERIAFLEGQMTRIASKAHLDRSCSLEAQGFDELECAVIGEKDGLAQIAAYALKGKIYP